MSNSLILVLVICGLSITDSARILSVFPTPSISHQVVFRTLTQELAKRGHEVIVLTTDPAFPKGQAPTNLTEIDVHDVSYAFYYELLKSQDVPFEMGKDTELNLLQGIQMFYNVMEVQMRSEPVQKLINSNIKIDLLLIEAFMTPAIVFSHIFKAPVIQVSSFGATLENLETVGAPTHPLLYPIPYRQRVYNLSLWDKLYSFYYYIQNIYYDKMNVRLIDEMLQRIVGSDTPSVSELLNNVDMLFLNVHPIWMDNHPMPSNVIFMGGLHQKPTKVLPQDLKSYLDSSRNGVVYVSFGTNVHPFMFPPERLKELTETFSELPYDVLFKWNDDDLPGRTENIKISKWLPQSDLLKHPNVKAFVMQGGLQSTDEAITAGVPLVCIPMLADQWYNAEKYVKLDIGRKVDFLTFTKAELKGAIESVINDKSYRESMVRLRERMADQPQPPLQRAAWWAEYVARHGGARHLRSPAANVPWAQYYELELLALALACLAGLLALTAYLFILLWRCTRRFATADVKVKRS